MSPILFVLAMQLFLKATEKNADIVKLGGGFEMSPVTLQSSHPKNQLHTRY